MNERSWWECICRGIYPDRPSKTGVSSFSSVSTTSQASPVKTIPQKKAHGLLVYSKYDSTSNHANSIAIFKSKLAAAQKTIKPIINDAGKIVLSETQLTDILNNPKLIENIEKFSSEDSILDLIKNIGNLDDSDFIKLYIKFAKMANTENYGRFAKEDFPDHVSGARTSVLAWRTDDSGESALIATPNRKLADWKKYTNKNNPEALRGKGTAKTVKECYCIVGDTTIPLVRARMGIARDNLQELDLLVQNFSDSANIMLPKYVSQSFLHYDKKTKQEEVSIYAFYPSAICSLDAIIGSDDNARQQLKEVLPEEEYIQYLDLINGNSELIPKTILQIMQDISMGIKEIHDKGFVHQDLKAPNILLFNEGGQIRAKIADFGLIERNNELKLPNCSLESAAPEIFAAHANYPNDNTLYYSNANFPSYGKNLYKSNSQNLNIYPKISTAQDIFSAGMVFAGLLSGTKPRNLPNIVGDTQARFPFLQDFLAVKQSDRINADQLLEKLQELYVPQRNTRT